MSTMRHKSLSDCLSIAALRRTEILEYGMIKQLQAAVMSAAITTSSTQQHDDGIMALGKSISGIFGWSSSSSNSSGGGRLATSGHSQDPSLVNNNNYQGSNYATAAINAALDPTFKHKLLRCLRVHLSSSSSSTSSLSSLLLSRMRAVLCPYKLHFAMLLADFGLLTEAAAYTQDVKTLIAEVGMAGIEA